MKQKCAEWLLLIAVSVIAFIVYFAHATAVKYIALAWMALALLGYGMIRKYSFAAAPRRRATAASSGASAGAVGVLPARVGGPGWALGLPMLLWAIWAALSLIWSVFPGETAAAWLDEIGLPFLGFFAFYALATVARAPLAARASAVTEASVRAGSVGASTMNVDDNGADRPRRAAYVESASLLAIVLLACISVLFMGHLQPDDAQTGLMHYYARVGHTSTLAVIAMPLFVVMLAGVGQKGHLLMRFGGLLGLVGSIIVGLASLNRFFIISGVLTLLIACVPFWRRRWVLSLCLAVVVGVVAVGTLVYTNEMRRVALASPVSQAKIPSESMSLVEQATQMTLWTKALSGMAEDDTRPLIWRFYTHEGMLHPWIGIGFGKRLPSAAYADAMSSKLLQREAAARTHAHNLFLNTWLEVGVIGLILQCWMFFALIRSFLIATSASPWLRWAGVALVIGVISKNLTDDFMWQSTMLAFWVQLGWMLGWTKLSSVVRYRAVSGRSVAMRRLRRVGT